MHLNIEHYKGLFHMGIFLIVLLKMNLIDRQLRSLERTVENK